ncbi:flagellar protein FlaG [Pseudomonas sp. NyZ704]|nr:flagellar protein FlaG [Pseudomonas sp. NyZ704]
MGILKPFDVSRTARSSVAIEASAERSAIGQKDFATSASAAKPVATQTRDALAQPSEIAEDELKLAVSDIQDFVQSVRRDINFQLDDSSGRVVVNVTEASSGEVIRQIPSEEALRLSENLSEIRSLLFEAEA